LINEKILLSEDATRNSKATLLNSNAITPLKSNLVSIEKEEFANFSNVKNKHK
jgi:hypothetical protein